jgi:SAM-dependent methyltransferase
VLHRQRFRDGPLGDGYDVVVCRHCGAGFAEGIPLQEELDRYYAAQSKYTYDHAGGAESAYDFKRFEIIADQIIPFLRSREARILDVGCATGGLLSVFKRRGFGNVLGVDPSPACAQAARRLHGVEVRTATLAQLAGWQESFDLILLVGVLEHLRDVQPAVRTVAGRLKAGGLLYCAQPDVAAFADCVNAPYQQFSVEHVNFFSEVSLNRLLAACGLTPRQTWRWMMEWREGVTDSVVSGIYAAPPAAEVSSAKFQVPRGHNASPSSAVRPSLSPSSAAGAAAKLRRSEDGSPSPSPSLSLQIDRATAPALERYLAQCKAGDEKLLSVIERLVRSQEPVLIWGAGTLTRRLLESTRLSEANIVAFVDSNPGIQGRRLAGRDIISPAQIAGRRETIVVCSKAFEREIIETIRNQLRLPNKVITL